MGFGYLDANTSKKMEAFCRAQVAIITNELQGSDWKAIDVLDSTPEQGSKRSFRDWICVSVTADRLDYTAKAKKCESIPWKPDDDFRKVLENDINGIPAYSKLNEANAGLLQCWERWKQKWQKRSFGCSQMLGSLHW